MNTQKMLLFCSLVSGQLLAMEEKPRQALAVKKSDEVSLLTDANSSHLGFWGKTGMAVGAVGGLATIGIGAGLFFAPKEDRDLGYKERVTKVLARIGALLRWHAPAGENNARVDLEPAELGGAGQSLRAMDFDVRQIEQSCEGFVSLVKTRPSFFNLSPDSIPTIGFYAGSFTAILNRKVKEEEVLPLLRKYIDEIEAAKRNGFFAAAATKSGLDTAQVDAVFTRLKEDFQILKVLSVWALVKGEIEQGHSFERTIEGYRNGLAKALQREVAQGDVLDLLQETINDCDSVAKNLRVNFFIVNESCSPISGGLRLIYLHETFKKDLAALKAAQNDTAHAS